MSKCQGCGVVLQSEDETKEGYVPSDKIDAGYCKRCFRSMHYGENAKQSEPMKTKDILKKVNSEAKFVVFMSSFIDIFDDVIDIFKKIKKPKIFLISKSDIIPENVGFTTIKEYLRRVYGIKEEIYFTTSKSSLNTLIKKLESEREIYFLGLTNSGKSTLINKLLELNDETHKKLATSYKENTTQDFIYLNAGKMKIVDTPGFALDNFELNKYTNISKEIKPITYQNKAKCTFRVGDLFSLSIDGKSNVVFYFSKNIKIDRLYNKYVIGTSFTVDKNTDIVICGLGFIKTTDRVVVTIPSELFKYINIRPSIVGGKF